MMKQEGAGLQWYLRTADGSLLMVRIEKRALGDVIMKGPMGKRQHFISTNPVTSSFSYPVTDSRVVQASLRSSQIKNNMAVCSADLHTQ